MHELTVGDGYEYLTRHVAAGDAGLSDGDSLTAYYELTGNPHGRWIGGSDRRTAEDGAVPKLPQPKVTDCGAGK
ncbi:hypothetical protein [Cellulomonas sp.]|uniref:hypothetical protein n=1 Tax=Cellulomonas sp. TaxID=40001 RepID=UPI003BABF178